MPEIYLYSCPTMCHNIVEYHIELPEGQMLRPKTIMVNMYLLPKQKLALDKLTERSRIPRAVLVREAIDDLLTKHAKTLKGGAR